MSRVTIKDVAKQAGVSPTTVSFAFNNPERLPQETVATILKIAEELHYVPNPVARSMILGRAGTIGVIVPMPIQGAMLDPFVSEFLLGVSEVCDSDELSIMILPPTESKFERTINRSMVDGFITSMGIDKDSQGMEFLIRRGIPIVIVDSEPIERYPSVNIDDELGAYLGMRYILECGHRNISIILSDFGFPRLDWEHPGAFRSRINGYEKALDEFGLNLESSNVHLFESPNDLAGAERVFPRIWAMENRPTAIVAMSDMVAYGVILAAKNMNVHVPEDLSVLGFDDLQLSAGFIPPLTTIHQPNYEKGKLAAEMLIGNLNGAEVQHIILPSELRIRDSVSKIHL